MMPRYGRRALANLVFMSGSGSLLSACGRGFSVKKRRGGQSPLMVRMAGQSRYSSTVLFATSDCTGLLGRPAVP